MRTSLLIVFSALLLFVPFLAPANGTGGCRYSTVSIAPDRWFSVAAMLFSPFYRLKLSRGAGWTTAPSWLDTASLRRCQVRCFLLPPTSGPPRAVLPTAGCQGYGVFSRFCCHRFYWSLACSRSGIDFGLPPRLSRCWLGPMRQSLEFCWQRFINLFGQARSIQRRAWRSPSSGLQIWKIAPWILVQIGAVIGGIFL